MTATKEIHDNDGGIPHLVAASDAPFLSEAPFSSNMLDSGDTYAFTSTKAGAFACNRDLHPREQERISATRRRWQQSPGGSA
ncbi:cupredoxin domain-containing protein [Mesorhizobium silamurunense]|uniref:cupredoxin domain-containing protein n=1 Tax=Mesorhizobium silamurunense TaxID=499528 RepID=UPI0017852A6F|nr:hypothetical protein [Mesorhizobium silamurunense]